MQNSAYSIRSRNGYVMVSAFTKFTRTEKSESYMNHLFYLDILLYGEGN